MTTVVLAGAGHAHAQVLLDWGCQPVADVQLVVVSPHALAPYSGMVPGWLAGTYAFDEIAIDFAALCRHAGARWVPQELLRLDPARQCLHLHDGEALRYDWLSLNVGSTLTPPAADSARMLSMRPLAELRTGYAAVLDAWRADAGADPFRVTAVGGGAAGFESLLAVLRRLRQLRPDRRVQAHLLTRGDGVLPGYPAMVRRAAQAALRDAGVALQTGTGSRDTLDAAMNGPSDLLLWATGAQAHAWQRDPQRRGALAVDEAGFVRVDAQLRSVSHPNILAVGDCARWATPLPKAGVFAVRMGPVLLHNLRALLTRTPLHDYAPQRHFLSLLSTADGRAIASRGPFGFAGRWAWRWKDHIDRRFVRRFAMRPPASAASCGHAP